MPWPICDAMKPKRDFVELALLEGANVRELCRRFEITAPTAYKWLGRYRESAVVWMIGEAFSGEEVALRDAGEGRLEVFYCWKKLGVIDFADHREKGGGGCGVLTERTVGRPPEAPAGTGQNV